jgi:hypothetical protein
MSNPDKRVPCTPINTSAIKGSQPSLRALTFFGSLPPHHKTFRVRDDASAPHLKPGEFAVIDARDTELQKGEVYLIQYERGSRYLVQISTGRIGTLSGRQQLVWWACDLAGFRRVETLPGGIPCSAGVSDGPYSPKALRRKLLGRLVGYSETALCGLLDACAEPA